MAGVSGSEADTGQSLVVGKHLARMDVVRQRINHFSLAASSSVHETRTLRDLPWRISTELAKLREWEGKGWLDCGR